MAWRRPGSRKTYASTASGCATRPRSTSVTSTRKSTISGVDATVIAWIWARTVTCPNPACAGTMPLVRSFWLGKKPGLERYAVPDSGRASASDSKLRVRRVRLMRVL